MQDQVGRCLPLEKSEDRNHGKDLGEALPPLLILSWISDRLQRMTWLNK